MPKRLKPLTTSPRTVLPVGLVMVSPSTAAPAPLPLICTTGAPVQPGCRWASITSARLIGGRDDRGASVATPPLNRLTLLRSPGALLPLPSMKIACSTPAVRPSTASVLSSSSALALLITCRRLPAPLSLVLVMVVKLKPKSSPGTFLPRVAVTADTACAVPDRPALYT